MNDEVMTLTEIASYLKVSEKTIVRMVQSGKLPGAKVASQWRFTRAVIDDWLNARMYVLPKKELLNVIGTANHIIPVSELISPERIIMDIQPGEKESICARLIEPLHKSGIVVNPKKYLAKVIDREAVISTAIGRGVAVPHVREPEKSGIIEPCIVLGICKEGTDFDSLDGHKTHIFAMPCTNTESAHLRLLATISLIFRQDGVLKKMLSAKKKEDIVDILATTDKEMGAEL